MASDRLGIYFLDVGQGDCTFIVPPRGEATPVLFDCADHYVAERFVAAHGITNLSAVVASHLDRDHVRGLLPFLRNHFAAGRQVERLIIGLDRHVPLDRYRDLRELIVAALEWERRPPHRGFTLMPPFRSGPPMRIIGGSDWSVDLVLPWYGTSVQAMLDGGEQPNRCSAVLRICRGDTAVLVAGDAPLGSWERLEPALLPARALRTPHHGGEIREAGERWRQFSDLYQPVQARLAVISVGSANPYGHPFPEHAAAALRDGSCRLICTQMTSHCHDDPERKRSRAIRLATAVEFPYRHRAERGHDQKRPEHEVPCAGSVVLALDKLGRMSVEPAASGLHDKFIEQLDHPLCSSAS